MIHKDNKKRLIIEFQNPSIIDFIISYLNDNKELLVDIINSTIFINQLYTIFSFNISTTSKIKMDDPLYALFRNKIINDFDNLDSSKLWYSKSTYNSYFNEITVIEKIHLIVKNLSVIIDNPLNLTYS